MASRRLVSGLRPYGTAQPRALQEYFVMVPDRPGVSRRTRRQTRPIPLMYTFLGECLTSPSEGSGQVPQVIGNAFACLAPSKEAVKKMMKDSPYSHESIWDLESTSITPLLTVHSGNLRPTGETGTERATFQRLSTGKLEHLVVFPDAPNVLERRVAIRPRHSPNFVRLHNEGYVSWAGPIFEEHVDADITERPFKGSVMVVNEGSWRGLMDRLQSDIYVQESIWDLKRTSFIQFRTIMRRAEEDGGF